MNPLAKASEDRTLACGCGTSLELQKDFKDDVDDARNKIGQLRKSDVNTELW